VSDQEPVQRHVVTVALLDEAATLAEGARFARAIPDDAAPLVLHLNGELGAGKTTLARGMLRALGEAGPVRSPTFALLAEYTLPRGRVMHLDLYRMNSAAELSGLGLADHLPGSLLWLVEWPEKAENSQALPAADADVSIAFVGVSRAITVRPRSPLGARWAAALATDSG